MIEPESPLEPPTPDVILVDPRAKKAKIEPENHVHFEIGDDPRSAKE
jgi:hypothetical protein